MRVFKVLDDKSIVKADSRLFWGKMRIFKVWVKWVVLKFKKPIDYSFTNDYMNLEMIL